MTSKENVRKVCVDSRLATSVAISKVLDIVLGAPGCYWKHREERRRGSHHGLDCQVPHSSPSVTKRQHARRPVRQAAAAERALIAQGQAHGTAAVLGVECSQAAGADQAVVMKAGSVFLCQQRDACRVIFSQGQQLSGAGRQAGSLAQSGVGNGH